MVKTGHFGFKSPIFIGMINFGQDLNLENPTKTRSSNKIRVISTFLQEVGCGVRSDGMHETKQSEN